MKTQFKILKMVTPDPAVQACRGFLQIQKTHLLRYWKVSSHRYPGPPEHTIHSDCRESPHSHPPFTNETPEIPSQTTSQHACFFVVFFVPPPPPCSWCRLVMLQMVMLVLSLFLPQGTLHSMETLWCHMFTHLLLGTRFYNAFFVGEDPQIYSVESIYY